MAIEKSEEPTIDYSFISKYIRNDSDNDKQKNTVEGFSSKNFEAQNKNVVEVFGTVGEEEGYSKNSGFFKKPNERDEDIGLVESPEKIEQGPKSKVATEAKKEFIKHLEDDSLTVDTCNKLNHDWKNK